METNPIKEENGNSSASVTPEKPDCDDETQRDGKTVGDSINKKEDGAEYQQAIKNPQRMLDSAKKATETDAEVDAYIIQGAVYSTLGDYKQCIEYSELALLNAKKLGNRDREGRAYCLLGSGYKGLGDLNRAMEYFKFSLDIAKELGERDLQALAYRNLGDGYEQLGDFKEAVEYHRGGLDIAKQAGDTDAEGDAYIKLGAAYYKLGDNKQCIEYSELALLNVKELANRDRERRAYCNLGAGYKGLGDLNRAMEYYKLDLEIAKELGDRDLQARAYCNLGAGYHQLGDFKQAVEYHRGRLNIAKQAGNNDAETDACITLGFSYVKLGDYKQCIEYSELALLNAKKLGNRDREERAYCLLGTGYQGLGDLNRAMNYYKLGLEIAKELGDKNGEACAYDDLGTGYHRLGDFKQAVEYHEKSLKIAHEVGDWKTERGAYTNLGIEYKSLNNFNKAMTYSKLSLHASEKQGDKEMEGIAYCNIGLVHHHLYDFKQAIECQKKSLNIAKERNDKTGEKRACLNLGAVYRDLGDFKQSKEYCQRALEICQKIEDRDGVARAYHGCGICSESLGNMDEALLLYKASIKQYNEIRRLIQSKDEWNISYRSQYQEVYDCFQNLLLMQNKIVEALSTTEHGRAQALEDLLHSQYGLEAVQSDKIELGSSKMVIYTEAPVLYVSVQENVIDMWLLQEGKVLFTQEKINAKQLKINDAGDLKSFIDKTLEKISPPNKGRCEDRTLDAFEETDVGTVRDTEPPEELGHPFSELCTENIKSEELSVLYDVTVGAVAELIHGTELIIVPDGPLLLAPFAAFLDPKSQRYLCESLRIRILPSLTSLKMISLSPPDYHSRRGVLIVGDPCVEKIVEIVNKPREKTEKKKKFQQLKWAREEAKMIGRIVNVKPLIGEDATKAEVLKRLNTAALVHIAAHGDSKTGEIALAPNPSADSKIPEKEDYMLTMAEVLNVGLRAGLVVLSCCNSGCGEIKAEGVVGISRAFLGAGARSVLVSLWAVEDEATLEFMRSFYQHLVDGKSASEALKQAMKCMRESQKFNAVKHWAPFVLIGDDVSMVSKETRSDDALNVGAADTRFTNQDEDDSIPIMDRMTNTINILKEGRYSDIGPVIAKVFKDVLQPYRETSDRQLRQKYGDHLCEIGGPAQLTMLLHRLIDIGMETEEGWEGMYVVHSVFLNYADASLKMASALGQSGALKMMLNDLDTYGPQQSEDESKRFLVSSTLRILYNCAKASENQQIFFNLRAAKRIAPLLKAEDMKVVMMAILTLSYITTDAEAGDKVISYLLDILRNSLDQSDLRENGFSALEIAVGLGNIAVNESNRETMIDREAISLLVSLIIKGGDTEKECAANALWVLVKDSRGKAKFKETPEAMEELSRLSTSGNHSVQKSANRVLIGLKETSEVTRDDQVEECRLL